MSVISLIPSSAVSRKSEYSSSVLVWRGVGMGATSHLLSFHESRLALSVATLGTQGAGYSTEAVAKRGGGGQCLHCAKEAPGSYPLEGLVPWGVRHQLACL